MKKGDILKQGVFTRNPVLFLILGLCPTLAVTTSLENGLGMGLSALIVLVLSNTLISIFKNFIPEKIRIPSFIVIIATFVTIIAMLLEAYLPDLFEALGIYIPLIVVNCIILARADSFARKNTVTDSIIDGLAMGLGFTLALSLIGTIRELFGNASIVFMGNTLMELGTERMIIMILPPGALLTIGLIIAALNYKKYLSSIGDKR
jgi:electron transport complex protein RnfE